MSTKQWKELSQISSTQCDSSSDRDQQISLIYLKTNPLKHKTELCKTFSELGYCNYGEKCRFAHGKHQLISSIQSKVHSDRKCNGFWRKGACPYGLRCQFGHYDCDWKMQAYLAGQKALLSQETKCQQSRLLKLL